MFREIFRPILLSAAILSAAVAETMPYSHGNPTAEEQYMLELMNRARQDPAAEGIFLATTKNPEIRFATDFFNVNLARLKSDFASYAPRPPFAFNPQLMAASRPHSKDMAENHFQDHTGTDGSTIPDRIADAGYAASAMSECIYSNLVSSTVFAHAGFNIDWGVGKDGIQAGFGHRKTIMGLGDVDYREIGISIVFRSGADADKFGKLSVTQDYGNRPLSPVFLVGVAYYDVNANHLCDPGEGLSGVRVQPDSGSWHAITSGSGGYAIPFSAATGPSNVTFSGGGLKSPVIKDFKIDGENVKRDLRITSGVPFVALVAVDKIASENGSAGDAGFQIVRVGPVDSDLKVVLSSTGVGSSAASTDDFQLSAVAPAGIKKNNAKQGRFFVTIPASKSFAEIKFSAVADKKIEPTEKADFGIVPSEAYRTGSVRSLRIAIQP